MEYFTSAMRDTLILIALTFIYFYSDQTVKYLMFIAFAYYTVVVLTAKLEERIKIKKSDDNDEEVG